MCFLPLSNIEMVLAVLIFPWGRQGLSVLWNQYHSGWCAGHARAQNINCNGIGLVCLEYTRFSIRGIPCAHGSLIFLLICWWWCDPSTFKLILNVGGPSYSGSTLSISWLLMPWLLALPGHHQPWYWICWKGKFWLTWERISTPSAMSR